MIHSNDFINFIANYTIYTIRIMMPLILFHTNDMLWIFFAELWIF